MDFQTARRFFTGNNAASYDVVVRYATLNQDERWKRRISSLSKNSFAALDLACGTGILSQHLKNDDTTVLAGLDLTREYLFRYASKIGIPAAQATAELLPFRENLFDVVASSYLAKYIAPEKVVAESHRVLRPGGLLIFHDFSLPKAAVVRLLWKAHFGVLQVAGLFVRSWRVVFSELMKVIEESEWEDRTLDALKSSGFVDITIQAMSLGTSSIISGRKP